MHKNNITKILDCKGITVEDIKIGWDEEYVHIDAKVDKPKKCNLGFLLGTIRKNPEFLARRI